MSPLKRFALLAMFPAFVLVLSGCGAQTQSVNQTPTPVPPAQAPAASSQTQQQAQAPSNVADIAAQKQSQLPALPANNRQAVDTEINNINKDLGTTSNAASSTDLSNANLGL
ncbi:MAG TPA: hypothetical protein VF817_04550 [Patescibacteria group bacterium]